MYVIFEQEATSQVWNVPELEIEKMVSKIFI